jgi:hypothetical protein
MNMLAQAVAELKANDVAIVTFAEKVNGVRVEVARRVRVLGVDGVPRPDHKGRAVVWFTYEPARGEASWCGWGSTFVFANEGPRPFGVQAIARTGETQGPIAFWSPRPGDRAYDNVH